MDYEYKNYHDNRAFQFHNNNILTKGKTAKAITNNKIYGLPINDDALDVVIVSGKHGSGKFTEAQTKKVDGKAGYTVDHDGIEKTSSICRRHHRERRRRHNATQTTLAAGWQQLGDDSGNCSGLRGSGGVCPSCLSICTISSCMKHAHCFHHGEQRIGAGAGLAELTCHCHITHHCHQYSPSGHSSKKSNNRNQQQSHRRSKSGHCSCHGGNSLERQHDHQRHHHHHHSYPQQRRRRHHHHHRHQQPQQQQQQQLCDQNRSSPHFVKQFPVSTGSLKSSLDSSAEQLCQQELRPQHCQEIAIEIDAATMTEDNGSTATSNFAYKMAKDHSDNTRQSQYSDKLVPYNCRRSSFNSNTTSTDELSRDDDGPGDDEEHAENDEAEELTPHRSSVRTENNSSITPRGIRCDLDNGSGEEQKREVDTIGYCPYGMPLSGDIHNENVHIKRKRFIANPSEYCSSCSSCSCARCDDNTSSCSSLDDDEIIEYTPSAAIDGRPPYEFTVSAECHHCNLPRQSSSASTTGEADDEGDEIQENKAGGIRSSTTSRRSSESFCSCNSNSCYHCSCSCEDCDTTGRMRSARDALSNAISVPNEIDEQHSSTLTPLTNPSSLVSTPLGDDAADLTMQSGNSNIFASAAYAADDASSLSQSAEYFSITSSNQPSQATPTITPVHKASMGTGIVVVKDGMGNHVDRRTPPVKQCKHYSKHHRHKQTDTTQDGYL